MNRLRSSTIPVPHCGAAGAPERSANSLSGLYWLDASGCLARCDTRGRRIADPHATATLKDPIGAVLKCYREGRLEGLNLALAADPEAATGTMVYSDWLLNELFPAGRGPCQAPTLYAQRNKLKNMAEGMALLLCPEHAAASNGPRYCPVLVAPQAGADVLCARYGVPHIGPYIGDTPCFEVLNLAAPYGTPARARDGLMAMVRHMRAGQLRPAVVGVDGPAPSGLSTMGPAAAPAELAGPEPGAATCFGNGDPVSGPLLEWFTPFNELSGAQRDIIAGCEAIRKAGAGRVLVKRGARHGICIYLLEGALAVTAPDGARMHVRGGTRRSRLPISALSPHVFEVTALSDVSMIVFEAGLIEELSKITRTYTSVARGAAPRPTAADASNSALAARLRHPGVKSPADCP